MAKTLLDIWLDFTLGKVLSEDTDQIGCLNAAGSADAGTDSLASGIQNTSNIFPIQNIFGNEHVQEGK